MNADDKKPCCETGKLLSQGFAILPDAILLKEIFPKLELESLCSLSCACRSLRSLVSQALAALPCLNLSSFSPSGELLGHIVPRLRGVKCVTIECLRLEDISGNDILGVHTQELNLLKCVSLSYDILASVGEKCPNLRILLVELAWVSLPEILKKSLQKMLKGFLCLEYLSIKVRGTECDDAFEFAFFDLILPKTVKFLKLQPVNELDSYRFIQKLTDGREIPRNLVDARFASHLSLTLRHLSLVLDFISDRLIAAITNSLPLLVELDLEDRPCTEPKLPRDLTNMGLQFLGSCQFLTSLSIARSRQNHPVSFKRVNDLGLFLLSASFGGLESVRLGGFSIVTDAGFSSLLRSCNNLKKFEVRSAPLLSDLTFTDIIGVVCPLIELKVLSCNLITSEAIAALASCSTLEVLNTNGCRSIADSCLNYVSCLRTLKSLNLGGADITDTGLGILSKGDLPLVNLSLRGCTRVNDRGIICLLNGERIKKTLSYLDIGHMPGVSDRAIHAIVLNAEAITELCMRYCYHVTDFSVQLLASGRPGGKSFLQKLDLCHCKRVSAGVMELFQMPLFRGLRWVGVGGTSLWYKRNDFALICTRRPWLTICFEGCEVGCHDGWQFHKNGSGLS